ncbi:MAG: M28 family peptidase [Lewinellaceae bacterium]|nr:M28 family peptidase [Lewinellaceae bacterium]
MALKIFTLIFSCVSSLALPAQSSLNKDSLLAHVRELSSDQYEGRRTQEAGNLLAGEYICRRFDAFGLKQFGGSYIQPFRFYSRWNKQAYEGRNIIGYCRGTDHPEQYIVLSAHYDHEGVRNGEIYNGADDNASGVGALLEMARFLSRNPPRHSVIFAAFDAEEIGLRGADHFLEEPPVPLNQILLNINMDMISRNAGRELYAVGTGYNPFLRTPLENIKERYPITVSFGHEQPQPAHSDDWTMSSDHGKFHQKNIPFLYFGVEDHEDYHKPTDDYERIMPDFYAQAAEFILESLLDLDKHWERLTRR